MHHVSIPMPSPIILYDPSDVNVFGGKCEDEAKAIAKHRGIPAENILPLPEREGDLSFEHIRHNGYVIVLTHGNESTNFKTVTLRSKKHLRVTPEQFVALLADAGLFADRTLSYRFELVICAAASGSDTFAKNLYDQLQGRVDDVMVKAPVGLASVSGDGSLSVTYFHLASNAYSGMGYAAARLVGWAALQPIRAITNRFASVRDNPFTRHNVLLHDWFYYPIGKSF